MAAKDRLEKLTDELSGKAWEIFCEIEKTGGFRKAFQKGWVQEQVEITRKKRLERISSGRDHLLGTNAFPNFSETIAGSIKSTPKTEGPKASFPALKPFRAAEPFEELRLQTERSDRRPRVFLFKYGNPAWVSARATFSGNFFACAGYEIIDPAAFKSMDEGVEAAKAARPDVIVL